MVEVIESGEPAIIVCHWPGVYFNGEKTGFNILKQVKKRLDQKYDNLIWMKLSEIARYWAAKELTAVTVNKNNISLKAPFSTPGFMVKLNASVHNPGIKRAGGEPIHFERIKDRRALKANTWYSEKTESFLCFNLEKGINDLILS
jgi:hypothetical protein